MPPDPGPAAIAGGLPAAVYLGDSTYRLPGEPFAVEVTFPEDCCLQAFLGREAMTLRRLVRASGVAQAPRVLRRLLAKYPGLAGALRRPGRKGAGGYRARVLDGRRPATGQQRASAPAAARRQ